MNRIMNWLDFSEAIKSIGKTEEKERSVSMFHVTRPSNDILCSDLNCHQCSYLGLKWGYTRRAHRFHEWV